MNIKSALQQMFIWLKVMRIWWNVFGRCLVCIYHRSYLHIAGISNIMRIWIAFVPSYINHDDNYTIWMDILLTCITTLNWTPINFHLYFFFIFRNLTFEVILTKASAKEYVRIIVYTFYNVEATRTYNIKILLSCVAPIIYNNRRAPRGWREVDFFCN